MAIQFHLLFICKYPGSNEGIYIHSTVADDKPSAINKIRADARLLFDDAERVIYLRCLTADEYNEFASDNSGVRHWRLGPYGEKPIICNRCGVQIAEEKKAKKII